MTSQTCDICKRDERSVSAYSDGRKVCYWCEQAAERRWQEAQASPRLAVAA